MPDRASHAPDWPGIPARGSRPVGVFAGVKRGAPLLASLGARLVCSQTIYHHYDQIMVREVLVALKQRIAPGAAASCWVVRWRT